MSNYPYLELTQNQIDQVHAVFDPGFLEETKVEIKTTNDGYFIEVSKMYEYVQFAKGLSTLQGYLKLAEILGCEHGDEVDRHSYSDCKTCDYGSSYSYTLKFW